MLCECACVFCRCSHVFYTRRAAKVNGCSKRSVRAHKSGGILSGFTVGLHCPLVRARLCFVAGRLPLSPKTKTTPLGNLYIVRRGVKYKPRSSYRSARTQNMVMRWDARARSFATTTTTLSHAINLYTRGVSVAPHTSLGGTRACGSQRKSRARCAPHTVR